MSNQVPKKDSNLTKTQKQKQKKKKNKEKVVEEPAARRRPRKQRNRKGKARQGHLVPTINKKAQGTRENIMVIAKCVASAVEACPLAVIARGYLYGLNTPSTPIYWAYLAFIKDMTSIMSNQVSPLKGRLRYINEIIKSWSPKQIPFKTGTLSYSWSGVDTVQAANKVVVRSYNNYLYVPGNTPYGSWLLQDPPSFPSTDEETYSALSALFTSLTDTDHSFLRYEEVSNSSNIFDKDTSAYIACSRYYGGGNNANVGPSMSVENEVPFKARLLGGTAIYEQQEGRVARNYGLSSGDTTCTFGYPFLPGFSDKFFRTAYPVQFKFIDLDEVVFVLQNWYASLVALDLSTRQLQLGPQWIPATDYALLPFAYTSQQFRIAVRQAVLSYFSAAAGLSQFQTYATDSNGFEPFRVGSNTYAPNSIEMRMPILLIENLRMLLPSYCRIPTKYANDKNIVMNIPVWGIYRAREFDPYNIESDWGYDSEGTLGKQTTTMFTKPDKDPSPIDGTGSSGEVIDLNSPIINQLISEWNARVGKLTQFSSPTGFLGGTSPTTLLTSTRYIEFEDQRVKLSEVPLYIQSGLPKRYVQLVKRASRSDVTKKNIISTNTTNTEVEAYYIPPSSSLATQKTRAFTSMQLITEQLRTLYQYFIFPSIAIDSDNVPSQRSVRVQNLESEILDYSVLSQDILSSRELNLITFASIMSAGLATSGKSDELTSLIMTMNDQNKGGFLGDILSGVASVVLPMIPF